MTIEYIISILERKVANLGSAKTSAEMIGDLDRVQLLEAEIFQTQASIANLKTLLS
jgi:hypothetical protein